MSVLLVHFKFFLMNVETQNFNSLLKYLFNNFLNSID